LRDKIGVSYGNPETTTGGNALKFYASVRIDIRKSTAIKDGDEVMGNLTKLKVVKNKVAPPFRRAEFDIMYGEGISRVGEILDLAVDNEVIKKSGSWYSFGDRKLGQGRDATKDLLTKDTALATEVETRVRAAMKTAGQEGRKPAAKKEDDEED
jgi:recombination protein RecA